MACKGKHTNRHSDADSAPKAKFHGKMPHPPKKPVVEFDGILADAIVIRNGGRTACVSNKFMRIKRYEQGVMMFENLLATMSGESRSDDVTYEIRKNSGHTIYVQVTNEWLIFGLSIMKCNW